VAAVGHVGRGFMSLISGQRRWKKRGRAFGRKVGIVNLHLAFPLNNGLSFYELGLVGIEWGAAVAVDGGSRVRRAARGGGGRSH